MSSVVRDLVDTHASTLAGQSYSLTVADEVAQGSSWEDARFTYDPGTERSLLGQFYEDDEFSGYVEQYFTADEQFFVLGSLDEFSPQGIAIEDGPLVISGAGHLRSYLIGAEIDQIDSADTAEATRYEIRDHRNDDILDGHFDITSDGVIQELEFKWVDDTTERTARFTTTDVGSASVTLPA